MKRATRLPEQAVKLIYEYDPTYRRDQFQKVLEDIPLIVSITQMVASHKHLVENIPTERVEFKEDT